MKNQGRFLKVSQPKRINEPTDKGSGVATGAAGIDDGGIPGILTRPHELASDNVHNTERKSSWAFKIIALKSG